MEAVIQNNIFDPILPFIVDITLNDSNRLVIELPQNITVETDEVLKYFHDDVELQKSWRKTLLIGRIKDNDLFQYIKNKLLEGVHNNSEDINPRLCMQTGTTYEVELCFQCGGSNSHTDTCPINNNA